MSETLYTPNWPIVGHHWAIEHITRSLNHDRVRHAYLITGPASIGKTTFARAFAQAVNCLDDQNRPCGVCRACTLIAHDGYADVSIIEPDGGTFKIEQIRDMQHMLSLRPVEARYRVAILRRFNEAKGPAMDALLKTLEEPPPYVILLLTADTTANLLSTIKSRCQPINLRPLPAPLIRQALEDLYDVETDRAVLLSQLSGGRMGWALRAVQDESVLAQRGELLDMLEKALGQSRVARFALADSLSKDKDMLSVTLDLWQTYWRDVLLLIHSTVTSISNRDRRHALEQIARTVSVEDVQRTLAAIDRTARYINQNVNARLALEVLMLDLPKMRLVPAPPG
jgi:DNA polymerase-3 subunit delta'